ncbi:MULTISPECIES: hypothetical protein [Comamonadaceae]|jgi:hypothetical protein|uniref:Exoribonuclease R n=1 Tax=Serpentinimonas maccroryi TaxID=1458426 RepID=A0A060P0E8_9BURK|nr:MULTISPECIES: hypothetical protein [Comamonadaceae]KJS70565.1 MAG: hypothetical protein JM57_08330 [Comamonadaceae bacterium BICA1-1]MBS3988366.1 hypothetical protein [Dethiobacter sp.]HQS65104.1 hypothetical protein [Acidovorax defluvii]BAO84619.1 exoribonuclease R [Serpentinimonas maccroryi]HQT51694.1 hypothetical protein [Acidovorax defluvii]
MSGIFTVTIGEENGMPSVALAIAGVFRPDSDVSQMVTNIVGALFASIDEINAKGTDYKFAIIGDPPTRSEPEKKAPKAPKGRKPRAPKTVDKSV